MATIEEALRAKLAATAGVTALVSTRIYPMGTKQLTNIDQEMIGFETVAGRPEYDHDGEAGIATVRWSVQAHSPTYAGAKAIASAVKAALSGFQGTVSGVRIGMCHCVATEDVTDPEARQQVVAVDFRVMYYG
jgi:hypothetical protein